MAPEHLWLTRIFEHTLCWQQGRQHNSSKILKWLKIVSRDGLHYYFDFEFHQQIFPHWIKISLWKCYIFSSRLFICTTEGCVCVCVSGRGEGVGVQLLEWGKKVNFLSEVVNHSGESINQICTIRKPNNLSFVKTFHSNHHRGFQWLLLCNTRFWNPIKHKVKYKNEDSLF